MKNFLLIALLASFTGCAHYHAVLHQRVNHEHPQSRAAHGPQVGPITVGDEQNLSIHNTYVLDKIYSRINGFFTQRRGFCTITLRWMDNLGVSDKDKEIIFNVLKQDGYSIAYASNDNGDNYIISW
jgi:hypothetical protein